MNIKNCIVGLGLLLFVAGCDPQRSEWSEFKKYSDECNAYLEAGNSDNALACLRSQASILQRIKAENPDATFENKGKTGIDYLIETVDSSIESMLTTKRLEEDLERLRNFR